MNETPPGSKGLPRDENAGRLGLSAQESRVLELALSGLTDRQVAEAMGISADTVKVYWARIRGKRGENRAQSIASLARSGSEAASERASRVYEAALRTTGIPFAVLDSSSGKALRVEPSFARLFGASPAEMARRPLGDWVPELAELPPADGETEVAVSFQDRSGATRCLRLIQGNASILVALAAPEAS